MRVRFGGPRYLRKELLWPHLDELIDNVSRYYRGHGRFPETDEEWDGVRTGKDPWGNPIEFTMEAGEARAWSAGPDGVIRTADDICYPPLD